MTAVRVQWSSGTRTERRSQGSREPCAKSQLLDVDRAMSRRC